MAAKIKAKRTSTISKAASPAASGQDPGQKPGQQKQKPGPGGQTTRDKKV